MHPPVRPGLGVVEGWEGHEMARDGPAWCCTLVEGWEGDGMAQAWDGMGWDDIGWGSTHDCMYSVSAWPWSIPVCVSTLHLDASLVPPRYMD